MSSPHLASGGPESLILGGIRTLSRLEAEAFPPHLASGGPMDKVVDNVLDKLVRMPVELAVMDKVVDKVVPAPEQCCCWNCHR